MAEEGIHSCARSSSLPRFFRPNLFHARNLARSYPLAPDGRCDSAFATCQLLGFRCGWVAVMGWGGLAWRWLGWVGMCVGGAGPSAAHHGGGGDAR
jgi:hypothetical protein